MTKRNKILLTILFIIFLSYIIMAISVPLFGKKLVISQIEENLKMKASLETINFSFLLLFKLRGLRIGDLAEIDNLSVSPSLLGFLAGKIVLNRLTLINPVITLIKSADGNLNLPVLKQKGKQPPLLLAGLVVKNGKLIFIDKKVDPNGYKVIVDNVNANISKIAFPPFSLYTRFSVSGNAVSPGANPLGNVQASGWIDFRPKDMDGKIEIKDLDATYFAVYLGDFISTQKLLSAKLNFTSDLKAKNNDLTAACHLQLSDLVYKKEEPKEGQKSLDLFPTTLDIFSDSKGNVDLDFTIKTKLDNPKIRLVNLQGAITKAAAQNISKQSPEEIMGKVGNAVNQFKDFGKQMKELFKKKE